MRKLKSDGFAHIGLIALVVVVLGLIGFAGYKIMKSNSDSVNNKDAPKPIVDTNVTKRTIYTISSPYDGGACNYPVFDSSGNRTEGCMDDDSVKVAIKELRQQSANDYRYLVKITADMHTTIARRTPSTPTPMYSDVKMYVIDKVYSIERTNIKPL